MRKLLIAMMVVTVFLATVTPQLLLGLYLPTDDLLERLLRLFGGVGWGYLVGGWGARLMVRMLK